VKNFYRTKDGARWANQFLELNFSDGRGNGLRKVIGFVMKQRSESALPAQPHSLSLFFHLPARRLSSRE
jgi:hypothetical protein